MMKTKHIPELRALALGLLILIVATVPAALSAQEGGKRVALVVGNAGYKVNPLSNPRNDAADMAVALRKAGFSPVIEKTDLDFARMSQVADEFCALAAGASVALFYYSGHAAQANDENYLIPVDMDDRGGGTAVDEKALKYWAFPVGYLADGLESVKARASVLVLDACRTYPVRREGKAGVAGLTPYQPPEGIAVLYATRAGETASDGGSNARNSTYTAALLQRILTPGLELSQLAALVGQDVRTATGGKQKPSFTSELVGLFQLVPDTGKPETDPARTVFRNEVFVKGGVFRMGSATGSSNEKPIHEVWLSDFYMNKYETTVAEFRQFVQASGSKTTAEREGGGWVVVNGDWTQKADANWENPYFVQTDTQPVVLVSWHDAVEYANWLSKKDGLHPAYTINGTNVICDFTATGWRLPTEAEWEYAARGGQNSKGYIYAGSNDANTVAWFWDNSGGKTKPVGTKAANELGLHDLSGNVWEWCWDWFGAYTGGSQTDPAGASSGVYRVLRGGSWGLDASITRSADRNIRPPGRRHLNLGFRLVRP